MDDRDGAERGLGGHALLRAAAGERQPGRQAGWATDLIGYDAQSSFGSASYYAKKMFSRNRGDRVLPVEVTPQAVSQEVLPNPQGGVGVGSSRAGRSSKTSR